MSLHAFDFYSLPIYRNHSAISLHTCPRSSFWVPRSPIIANKDTLEFERVYMNEHVRVRIVRDQISEITINE